MARPVPPDRARPCRRKLHTIPAGVMGCRECNKRSHRKPRTNATVKQPARHGRALAFIRPSDLPLAAILDGAACSPATADLFDVGAPKYAKGEESRRHAEAKEICRGCPVRDACLADATAHQSLGVYGGFVLNQEYWTKANKKALVQVVPSVPDSSAC